jgi:hypothetical protein
LPGRLDHQGRDGDRRQHVADVQLEGELLLADRASRAAGGTFDPCPPRPGERITRQVGGQDPQMQWVGRSPGRPDRFDLRLLGTLRHAGPVAGRTGQARE